MSFLKNRILTAALFIVAAIALAVLAGGNKHQTLAQSTETCAANLYEDSVRVLSTSWPINDPILGSVFSTNRTGDPGGGFDITDNDAHTYKAVCYDSQGSQLTGGCALKYFTWTRTWWFGGEWDDGSYTSSPKQLQDTSDRGYSIEAMCTPPTGGGGGGGTTTATLSTSPRTLTLNVDEIKTVTVSMSGRALKNFSVESANAGKVGLHTMGTPDSSPWNTKIDVLGTETQFKMKGISSGTTGIKIEEFSGGDNGPGDPARVPTGVTLAPSVTVLAGGIVDPTSLTVEPSSVTLEVGGSSLITVTGLSTPESSPANSIFRISNNTTPTVASASTPIYYNSGTSRRGTFTVTGLVVGETVMTVSSGNSVTPQDVTVKVIPASPANNDEDGDGVPDDFDRCLHTPADTLVDATGCTITPDPDSPPARPTFDFLPPVITIEDEATTPPTRPDFTDFFNNVICARKLSIVPNAWNMVTYPFALPSASAGQGGLGTILGDDANNTYGYNAITRLYISVTSGDAGKPGQGLWTKQNTASLCLVGGSITPLAGTQEITFPADQETYYELNMTGNPFTKELPWANIQVNGKSIQDGFADRSIAAVFLYDPTLKQYVTYYDAARFSTIQPPNSHAYTELAGETLAPYRGFWLMTKDGAEVTVSYKAPEGPGCVKEGERTPGTISPDIYYSIPHECCPGLTPVDQNPAGTVGGGMTCLRQ